MARQDLPTTEVGQEQMTWRNSPYWHSWGTWKTGRICAYTEGIPRLGLILKIPFPSICICLTFVLVH
jgi:hypothetical protein